jgi:tight adherence protein B
VGADFLLGKQKDDRRKTKEDLRRQFRDMVQSLAASLRAGYAVENAFSESYGEMLSLYGRDAEICMALRRILVGLKNNITVETLMDQFAYSSGVEEVYGCAEVFRAAKKSGGNLAEIMDKTAGMIGERIDTADEIKVAIAAKEMDQKIMNVVPFGIVFYISLTSPGFFDGLFGNLTGIMIMSGCLFLYLGAYVIGRKIIRFEGA